MAAVDSAYCAYCKKQVVARKKSCNHVLHVILSLITMGLWLPVWLICALVGDEWYCSQCGKSVRVGTHEPEFRCPECNSVIDADTMFCPHCGSPISLVCKKCNTKNSPGSSFCKNCGESLSVNNKSNENMVINSINEKSYMPPSNSSNSNQTEKKSFFADLIESMKE